MPKAKAKTKAGAKPKQSDLPPAAVGTPKEEDWPEEDDELDGDSLGLDSDIDLEGSPIRNIVW